MNLQLQEVIFETCNCCNRNCNYCGSASIKDELSLTPKQRRVIVQKISQYLKPGAVVTFSGGEATTLPITELTELVKILNNAKIETRIITNGDLLTAKHLALFNVIGISVNETSDIPNITAKLKLFNIDKSKLTAVTNFGMHNIFNFDVIDNFVTTHFGIWQVQLTMGKYQLEADGIKHLYEKISKCKSNYALADNLQQAHQCSAGINTMSITHDGYCVPCLSARSWGNIKHLQSYNLLYHSLQDVWENNFKQQRFQPCQSCRDCIKYPTDVIVVPTMRSKISPDIVPHDGTWEYKPYHIDQHPSIMLYSAINPNIPRTIPHHQQIIMYGAFRDYTMVYSVISANPDTTTSYIGVSSTGTVNLSSTGKITGTGKINTPKANKNKRT